MKKLLVWLTIFSLLLSITACKSEASRALEVAISDIGEATEESYEQIQLVRETYDQLSDKDKRSVSNYDELEDAELAYNKIIADKVVATISDIGPIDDESKDKIEFALSEYEALSEDQADLVTNLGELLYAQESYETYIVDRAIDTLSELWNIVPEDSATIIEAEKVYNLLTDVQKGRVGEQIGDVQELLSQAKIEIVNQLIARITYTKDEPTIDELETIIYALTFYFDLEEDSQKQVKKFGTLEKAIKAYTKYKDNRSKKDNLYIRQEYIFLCEEIPFEELVLYPKSYKDQQLVVEVEILEIKKGILLAKDSILAITNNTEEVLEIKDGRKVSEPILSVGDSMSVYGTFEGTRTFKVKEEGSGLFGTSFLEKVDEKYEIPVIEIIYTSIDNPGVIAEGNPNATDLELDEEAETLKYQLDALIEDIE